ncbi:MAG: PAS domain S-box protein [Candidatus Marinimicrobia bacterium]|nr:PAS domain S-box protein [Candidatus Neomarinimicrobiota bacterium]
MKGAKSLPKRSLSESKVSRKPSAKLVLDMEELTVQAAFSRNNPAPVLQTNYDGIVISANHAASEAFNERLAGKSIFSILTKLQKSSLKKITSSKPFQLDNSINGKEYQFSIVKDIGAKSFYLYGTEITDRRRADADLKENLSLDTAQILESLLEHSPAGIAILEGPDLRYVNINQNLADINGYPIKYHIGKTLLEVLPDAKKNLLPMMRKIMNDGKAVLGREFNIILPKDPDKAIYLMDYLFPIPNKQGKPIGIGSIVLDISQRKLAEVELHQSEERYKSFYVKTPVMLHSIDKAGNLVDVNDQWLDVFGYERSEVIGKKVIDFLTKESRLYAVNDALPDFMKKGYAHDVNYQFVKKNGEIMDTLLSAAAEYDSKGIFMRSIAVLNDITERRVAEMRLKQSKAKYRNLVKNLPDVTWITELDGSSSFVSDNVEKVFGYTPEEIYEAGSEAWSSKIHRDDQEMVQTAWNLLFAGESNYDVEFRIKRKDGRWIWINDRAISLSTEEDHTFAYGLFTDISERKQAEAALAESEEKYRSLVENSNVGIYILQGNKYVYVNETFEKMLGYKFEEVSADSFDFMDLVASESKEFISQRSKSREKGEKIDPNYVFKCITKTGHIIDLEAHTSSIEYEGKPAIQGIIKDVTLQMQDRREKIQLQEKLKQSERMESLGLLAGGVAHDLNNIIGPIMAYPDLIRRDLELGNPIYKDLDSISASVQRAADVIADLLALARRGNYKMETLDLNDLVNDYLDSAEYNAAKKLNPEVVTDIQLSESTLLFKGSDAHLPKVIMNLINNAFEAMSEGGVLSIATSSINVKDGELNDKNIYQGRYNLLTIEDQGEGISEENISKIFDPFFTTKKKTGKMGTGLGLSVVYNVLKDHGAYIDVESKLAVGTKFSIYFTETTEKKEIIQNDTQVSKGSGSILVVDDREEQREIATRILTALGYDVKSVDSGRESIKYLKNNQTDLIWLDMILEEDMDGLDVYKEIIKMKPNQKTIIVSGYSESDRVKEAESLGLDGFIQKPYKIDEIGQLIQTVLGNSNN